LAIDCFEELFEMNRPSQRTKEAGSALVTSLIFTFILALMVGAGITYVAAQTKNAWTKSNADAAALLAEAGINDELSYIARNFRNTTLTSGYYLNRADPPNAGAITDCTDTSTRGRLVTTTNGSYRVYVSANWDTTGTYSSGMTPFGVTAWNGKYGTASNSYNATYNPYGKICINCKATVNGTVRNLSTSTAIGGSNTPLNLYAAFGVNSMNNNMFAISSSGGNCDITGTIGTNGKVSANSGSTAIVFNSAINANGTGLGVTTSNQFALDSYVTAYDPSAKLVTESNPRPFPNVTQLMKDHGFSGLASSATDTQAWAWMLANNNNSRMRKFASTGARVSASGTVSFGATSAVQDFKTTSFNGLSTGTVGGTTGVKAVIFPPGDYYFTHFDVSGSGIAIIIDDAGLTVGGNTNDDQVRFWIDDATNKINQIDIPVYFSSALATSEGGLGNSVGDPSVFRLLYASHKDFTFYREPGWTGNLDVCGAVYAVQSTNSQMAQITFQGNSSASTEKVSLLGSLIADKVVFQGYSKLTFTPSLYNPNDIIQGVGGWGGYDDGS